jgi:hypothetical protein
MMKAHISSWARKHAPTVIGPDPQMMRWKAVLASTGVCALLMPSLARAALYITIVQGLGGQAAYDKEFTDSRVKIEAASHSLTDADHIFSFSGDDATRENLLKHFADISGRMTNDDRAAIYLIGHGSFDGETYKFNIPGPDLSDGDLKNVLENFPGQNHFLVNTSSTSGAMLESIVGEGNDASNPDYIIVSATRNGNERNSTHFGRFFAEALTNEEADLNKNNNVSIEEAFDFASRSVESYFTDAGRLSTEHAQLRGDGAAQFTLSRLNEIQLESADPVLNDLLQQRLALDAEIENLQLRRGQMSNAEYIQQLQALVLRSAELSERIDAEQQDSGAFVPPTEGLPDNGQGRRPPPSSRESGN